MKAYKSTIKTSTRTIQLNKINSSSFVNNRPKSLIFSNLARKKSNNSIQRVLIIGGNNTIHTEHGPINGHFTFDDTSTASLHITYSDHIHPPLRTWVARSYYTPISRTAGTWGPVENKMNTRPEWANEFLQHNNILNAAKLAFHNNGNIQALLNIQFPIQPYVVNNYDNEFPAL